MSRARRARKVKLGELVATARLRKYNVGPRKVREIADLIRGLSVSAANKQLLAVHRPSAVPAIRKLIASAMSNANQKEGSSFSEDELVVGKIDVSSGPIMYRMRPMSMGRAGRVRKRTCHVRLELYEEA